MSARNGDPEGKSDQQSVAEAAAAAGSEAADAADAPPRLTPRALSIDLEVGREDGRIHAMAAVRGDNGAERAAIGAKQVERLLDELDDFGADLSFLLGHNLLAFDAPHLEALRPDLAILGLPRVDTLRLNPLAFPRHPYHRLVKHYQDGALQGRQHNDPALDSRLTLDLFSDQWLALKATAAATPQLLTAWHWLTTSATDPKGHGTFFTFVRGRPRPSAAEGRQAVLGFIGEQGCLNHARELLDGLGDDGWPLAFALAWLSVAGGNSVMPPWVTHQFPAAGRAVRRLRAEPCTDPACGWCRERFDARRELQRWFGFDAFRPEPKAEDGAPLQQRIVEAVLARQHVLAILPTGTGKSLCYQLPALSDYDKTGSLTVVISPLVALMADQVRGLEARGVHTCLAINGLLSMPERADALQRVRLGDASILLISPEQLRSTTVRRALAQRQIGHWVLDEAHCLSKWGHDFRPDYRYVGRFIRERSGDGEVAPILCLTATAKPEVVADIIGHFQRFLGLTLGVFDGGSARSNLDFSVVPTSPETKLPHLLALLKQELPEAVGGGAIVYCSTRTNTEQTAEYLRQSGLVAEHFHAGLDADDKQSVQGRFIDGETRVIVATNAFGMGIDKPDVRLVVHADIPGSLENYLQEAGRAGRDRREAQCILLVTREDVERQFSMSARSRLTKVEIRSVLRALRRLERQQSGRHEDAEVIATTGEILAEDEGDFVRDVATDDTRVRTAISWLEEAGLMTREENRVQIFPASLRVAGMQAADKKIKARISNREYRRQLLAIVRVLLDADPDEGISTDDLMLASGLRLEGVRKAMADLEEMGVASNDMPMTAFLRLGIEDSSRRRLQRAQALEVALIDELMEAAPDLGRGQAATLHLRVANQTLKEAGHEHSLPALLLRLLRSLSNDGRGEEGGVGSIGLRTFDAETVQITLQREWPALRTTAELRREAAAVLLASLEAASPDGVRGKAVLAETTLGELNAALRQDVSLQGRVTQHQKLLDHALLWLHEQEVLRLHKGLTVLRPAMTIRLSSNRRQFRAGDYRPLAEHYESQVLQIHVMAEYARRGVEKMADALALAVEYFQAPQADFLQRWLPGREKELALQTTPDSWREIVEGLGNRAQQEIVTDPRVQTNVLVLAGPGSGKTRVLVHRIAFLVRVQRERPGGILALAYNRHAATEIRQRLRALIGDDAHGVTVLTCHALAMRLTGETLAGRRDGVGEDYFRDVVDRAAALLRGDALPPDEADAQREHLLGRFRWILVDEYQDIDQAQYELISALAGRSLEDTDNRLSLFAVGDDDQNIYAFSGASVTFIRRFEADFDARASYLVENYRSTRHLIDFANAVIEPAADRMKSGHPIQIDAARRSAPHGGRFEAIDPVGQGRVQLLAAVADEFEQAQVVMTELERLAGLDPEWDWSQVAVIARHWRLLHPVRAWCEWHGIPVQLAQESTVWFWRLRETQAFQAWLAGRDGDEPLVTAAEARQWLADQADGHWWRALREAIEDWALHTGGAALPWRDLQEWLVDWGRELRQRQRGLLLLSAHRAKGLEFRHVVILDGGWDRRDEGREDADAPRRLYYVAATRARETLALARLATGNGILEAMPALPSLQHRAAVRLPAPDARLRRQYHRLSPADVDLGYAGRLPADDPIHGAIAALQAGDGLSLEEAGRNWWLVDARGRRVGRLARRFQPPRDHGVESVSVLAILQRRREDSDPAFADRIRCDQWEVLLPEIIFSPNAPQANR